MEKTTYAILTFAALCASAFAHADDNMLLNDGFESGTSSWKFVSAPCYRVLDGQGYGGTKGLVWENDDPVRMPCPQQKIKYRPGHVYSFSALVKIDSLTKGVKPQVTLDWRNKAGKWSGAFYAAPVDDNGILRDGWVRYEGRTPPMPSSAANGAFVLYLPKGAVGRVRFDDAKAVECESRVVDYLVSSVFRDEAVDGDIRFEAALSLDVSERPLSGYVVELSYRDVDGRNAAARPTLLTEDLAVFDLKVPDFGMGAQDVAVFAREAVGGKTIGKASRRFTRLAASVVRRVAYDSQHRMLLDGKPFFPLGMFTRYMSSEDFEIYGKGPFNFAVQYDLPTISDLDAYGKIGVVVGADVQSLVYGYNIRGKSKFKTLEQSKEAFRAKMAEIGGHPALAMWYLNDEAPVAVARNIADVNDFLHDIDPEHATLTCLCHPNTAKDFLPSYDILSIDSYPIGYRRSTGPMTQFKSVWTRQRMADEAIRSMRPHWLIPQAFSWRWVHSDETVKTFGIPEGDMRFPSLREMLNMNWQGIAAGANGILMYSFREMRKYLKGDEFAKRWNDVCVVANELKKFESVILADPLTTGEMPTENIGARSWRKGGFDWHLVVSLVDAPVKGVVKLSAKGDSIMVAAGSGVKLSADGTALECEFDRLGYALVRVAVKKQ